MLKPFFVWQNKKLKRIDPAKVMCLLTKKNYTHICLSDDTVFMVRSSLTGAYKKLPQDMFIRIHQSMVASIYFIDDIARDHLIIKGESLAIGRQYYKSVFKKLNIIE